MVDFFLCLSYAPNFTALRHSSFLCKIYGIRCRFKMSKIMKNDCRRTKKEPNNKKLEEIFLICLLPKIVDELMFSNAIYIK